jgi:hypothetical protein
MVGTVNQIATPRKPFQLMMQITNAISQSETRPHAV